MRRGRDKAARASYLSSAATGEARLHFHSAPGFATLSLAHMLDSLVRVSRRVDWVHFVSILAALPRWEGPGRGTGAGRARCHHAGAAQFLHPTRELDAVGKLPSVGDPARARRAVTAGVRAETRGLLTFPPAALPGTPADADQQAADGTHRALPPREQYPRPPHCAQAVPF